MLSPDFQSCEWCQTLKTIDEKEVRAEMKIKDAMMQDIMIGEMMFHHDENSELLVKKIFIQGDARYWSKIDNAEDKVASFIYHNALKIENVKPPDVMQTNHHNDVTNPQKEEKERAIAIMESLGYAYGGQEVNVQGGIADVLMQKEDTTAVVECCSVTVSKGVKCFVNNRTELWIFARDGSIYKLTRGKNWQKMYDFYEKYDQYEEARALNRFSKIMNKMRST